MFKLLLFTILFGIYVFADETKSFPYATNIKSVQSIQKDGIIYGSGSRDVYVFIDPWCRYSRKFITLVSKNPKMLTKYRYHLYLYGIPRLHSQNAIAAVYRAKKPLETLLKIMIHDDNTTKPIISEVRVKVSKIKTVAKKLHVNKRPFLIIKK